MPQRTISSRRSSPAETWTYGVGIRRAIVSVAWRAGVTLGCWLLLLWGVRALADMIASHGGNPSAVGRLAAIGAGAIGWVGGFTLSRGLSDTAGFAGPVVGGIAALGAIVAFLGGDMLFAAITTPMNDMQRYMTTGIAMIVALGWIAYETMAGD